MKPLKIFVLILTLLGMGIVLFHPDLKPYRDVHTVYQLLLMIKDNWWASLLYIGIYTLACVFAFPGTLLTLAGGAVFGLTHGFLLTFIGANLGANLAFLTARYLGQGIASDLLKKIKGLNRLDENAAQNGFQLILMLRLIPLVPFNGLNFGSGLSQIKLKDYFLATLAGMIPGIFVYTYFASSIVEGVAGAKQNALINFLIASLLFLALSLVPRIYKKQKRNP